MQPRLLLAVLALGACKGRDYAAMQDRGRVVMGVDQYTSAHVFEDLPDGGRVVLDREDAGDSGGIATIRLHMRDIATSFRAGDFTKPFQVHAQVVPGTEAMRAQRAATDYQVNDRPRAAQLPLPTTHPPPPPPLHHFPPSPPPPHPPPPPPPH